MVNLPRAVIAILVVGSVLFSGWKGQWEASFSRPNGKFLMKIDSSPVWDKPSKPDLSDLSLAFPDIKLETGMEVEVYHKWDWWLTDLLFTWVIGSCFLLPLIKIFFSSDILLAAFARICGSLLISSLACLALWLLGGGWGAPFPLFFGFMGLSCGIVWAVLYYRAELRSMPIKSEEKKEGLP